MMFDLTRRRLLQSALGGAAALLLPELALGQAPQPHHFRALCQYGPEAQAIGRLALEDPFFKLQRIGKEGERAKKIAGIHGPGALANVGSDLVLAQVCGDSPFAINIVEDDGA